MRSRTCRRRCLARLRLPKARASVPTGSRFTCVPAPSAGRSDDLPARGCPTPDIPARIPLQQAAHRHLSATGSVTRYRMPAPPPGCATSHAIAFPWAQRAHAKRGRTETFRRESCELRAAASRATRRTPWQLGVSRLCSTDVARSRKSHPPTQPVIKRRRPFPRARCSRSPCRSRPTGAGAAPRPSTVRCCPRGDRFLPHRAPQHSIDRHAFRTVRGRRRSPGAPSALGPCRKTCKLPTLSLHLPQYQTSPVCSHLSLHPRPQAVLPCME